MLRSSPLRTKGNATVDPIKSSASASDSDDEAAGKAAAGQAAANGDGSAAADDDGGIVVTDLPTSTGEPWSSGSLSLERGWPALRSALVGGLPVPGPDPGRRPLAQVHAKGLGAL